MSDAQLVITDARVEDYTLDMAELAGEPGLSPAFLNTLSVMEETAERLNYPIAGRLVGRTLAMFAALSKAKRVFDAGDSLGYAATWIGSGLGSQSSLISSCNSQESLVRAREFHRRAELPPQIEYCVGRAADSLEATEGFFEFIYSDVSKGDYPRMAKLALERLSPGGVYIADSCLWFGKVCSGTTTRDAWTASVDQHNQWLFGRADLFTTIIDQSDGLLVAVKRPS